MTRSPKSFIAVRNLPRLDGWCPACDRQPVLVYETVIGRESFELCRMCRVNLGLLLQFNKAYDEADKEGKEHAR